MTRDQLNSSIDSVFNNNIPDNSLTPNTEGLQLKQLADYVDQQDVNIIGNVYKAKLLQSGTNNIIPTELINNTGLTFTYTRNAVGNYSVIFSSTIPDLTKMDIIINLQNGNFICPQGNINNLSSSATILTRYWTGTTFALSDDIINNATIYIITNN